MPNCQWTFQYLPLSSRAGYVSMYVSLTIILSPIESVSRWSCLSGPTCRTLCDSNSMGKVPFIDRQVWNRNFSENTWFHCCALGIGQEPEGSLSQFHFDSGTSGISESTETRSFCKGRFRDKQFSRWTTREGTGRSQWGESWEWESRDGWGQTMWTNENSTKTQIDRIKWFQSE